MPGCPHFGLTSGRASGVRLVHDQAWTGASGTMPLWLLHFYRCKHPCSAVALSLHGEWGLQSQHALGHCASELKVVVWTRRLCMET